VQSQKKPEEKKKKTRWSKQLREKIRVSKEKELPRECSKKMFHKCIYSFLGRAEEWQQYLSMTSRANAMDSV